MEQRFQRMADSIRLPESSRARIRAQIASHPEKQEAFKMRKKRKLPRLAVAILLLVAALTLTAAGTVIHKWSGFVWTGSMSEAEKKRMLEETSYLTAVEVTDADGTVHLTKHTIAGTVLPICSPRSLLPALPVDLLLSRATWLYHVQCRQP